MPYLVAGSTPVSLQQSRINSLFITASSLPAVVISSIVVRVLIKFCLSFFVFVVVDSLLSSSVTPSPFCSRLFLTN